MRKWVVVSGGVVSGLGKGIVSASIGRILRGIRVIPIKCDGYLNVDPGTMNPFEHGEVFVLEDGGEVDMDFGHYERFMEISPRTKWNLTAGKIFQTIIEKERRGDYLGKTVQIIPHVTNEVKRRWRRIYDAQKADVAIIEIGGTIGDIENEIFFEGVRQLKLEGDKIVFVHVTYVPFLDSVGEQKTKPTQQSVSLMLQKGIQPDIIMCRSKKPLHKKAKEKVALFSNLNPERVISNHDVKSVYELPLILQKQGVDKIIKQKLNLKLDPKLTRWKAIVNNILAPKGKLKIAICGKYTSLHDAYASINEALIHAGAHLQQSIEVGFIETTNPDVKNQLRGYHGLIVPGGFGKRGSEGKIEAIRIAREQKIPFLGLCLGMQLAIVEFARHVCGLKEANSTEVDPRTRHPVIFLLPSQRGVRKKGGTMRLGAQPIKIKPGTKASRLFKKRIIKRRFRHRYEVNPKYVSMLEKQGLVFSGTTKDMKIMQLLELPEHPFFMASQFHPEFSSRLEKPEPMFVKFIKSAMSKP